MAAPVIPLDVLYVDDDDDMRHIVGLSLTLDPAITIRFAGDGSEAMAAMAAGPLPDALLLDAMMPGIGGVELATRLHGAARTRDLPVVFVTARTDAADLARYRACGAAGVIAKPFDPLRLSETLRDRLAARQSTGPSSP